VIYFEPSALFKAYIPERGSLNVEFALSLLGRDILGATSLWSLLEIVWGFVKRRNLGEITDEELEDIIEFFISDMEKMEAEGKMKLIEVRREILSDAIELVRQYNLYAADALHIKTAEAINARIILVDDYHFGRIKGATKLRTLSVESEEREFKETLRNMAKPVKI